MSKLTVLQVGYGYTDTENCYRATGTSTLIQNKDYNIIVDTGGPWEKDLIVAKLNEQNITPVDVNIVIGTHGHSDHIGNLNLFPHAKQIVGFDINFKDQYLEHNFKNGDVHVLIENEIVVIPTPGHTHSDVSVIVYNEINHGVVGICGDLFECENDDGTWQTVSENIEMQSNNREKILKICDHIVPGHGPMFKI